MGGFGLEGVFMRYLHVFASDDGRVGIASLYSAIPHQVLISELAALDTLGTSPALLPPPTRASGTFS